MSVLAAIPDDVVIPAACASLIDHPLVEPRTDAEQAAAIAVRDNGEPLEQLPPDVPRLIVYDSFGLPHRDDVRLRSGVVARLQAARRRLPEGFDLVVLDAWRSTPFQAALREHYLRADAALSADYVAAADDPALRAGHTTGGAVDLTISWCGKPLALGTDYDDFSALAHPAAFEHPGADVHVRDLRRLLAAVMMSEGFAVYPAEWWHWSWGEQWWAAATGEAVALYDSVTEAPSA